MRVVLFDFKKAFDLTDHWVLVRKLCSCEIRANSMLNLAMTASQNGVLYWRGFPKVQKIRAMAVNHHDQRA